MEEDYIPDIDQIRKKEYPLLENTTYLDHAGTTLYSKSLIEQFSKDMCSNLFGNPHSASPASALSTMRTEAVRARVLRFFNADPEHFDCVFVANATAAIKLVLHAFQDSGCGPHEHNQGTGFWYGYHVDAHTSLVGVRQVASAGSRCFKSDDEVEDWLQDREDPSNESYGRSEDSQLGLFAYPAQSNMNGHRLPLKWAGRVRATHKNTYTLLDAAAYVSTGSLDLSDAENAPDFTALSFYKIFGFPDLGALIVRKAAGHVLQQRRYFGGGTVDMVIALGAEWHAMREQELHEQLEDGTLPFHNIIALDSALDAQEQHFGSMQRVSAHACFLARRLYEGLRSLKHANGLAVCAIYKHPDSTYGDSKTQGPTVAFNVQNSLGGYVGKSDVERLAIGSGIQLRTGGVCNPGGIATSLSLKPWELRKNFAEGVRCGNNFDVQSGKPTGIVRVSLGAMSNKKDVDHFIHFLREVFVEKQQIIDAATLQQTAKTEQSGIVRDISIYPIRGAKGWQVPLQTPWEVNEAGLIWDREWCLVSLDSGEALPVDEYSRIGLLQPIFHVEQGLLKIHLPSRDPRRQAQLVSISLWESPPACSKATSSLIRADRYPSKSLAEAFTSFIGVPCTLARFPDFRRPISRRTDQGDFPASFTSRIAQEGARSANLRTREQPLQTKEFSERPFTVSISSDPSDKANLQADLPLKQTCQYIRIGSQYYLSSWNAAGKQSFLRHLPNIFEGSPAAQHPTIKVGDSIHTLDDDNFEDPSLLGCIRLSVTARFICPVPTCRRLCETEEEKTSHLLAHRVCSDGIADAQPPVRARARTRTRLIETMRSWSPGKQVVLTTAKEVELGGESGLRKRDSSAERRRGMLVVGQNKVVGFRLRLRGKRACI